MRDRPVSARQRRTLARWLRRTTNRALVRDPVRRRREVLLPDRVAAVWTDLLEIAVMLERADDPDPACAAELRQLLSDPCESPLYNADVHVSELRATLYCVRYRLATTAVSTAELTDSPLAEPTGRPPRSTADGR